MNQSYNGINSQHALSQFLPFGEVRRGYLNAKELDEENGMYYYSARYYAPPTFISRDPLMDERPWLSPYHYCSNNPVNKIDPTGMEDSPVFGSDGVFRGTTKEGYTGSVIILDSPVNFSDMTENELLNTAGGTIASTYDNVRDNLSNDAKSSIWTHIVSQLQGTDIDGEKFSLNSIDGGKIHYDDSYDANWGTSTNPIPSSGKKRILGTDKYSKYETYETTVENIQSSVVMHEWHGHVVKGYSTENKNHSKAYESVQNSIIYTKTTEKYQNFTKNRLDFYRNKEK